MKIFNRNNNDIKRTILLVGALFVYGASFNTSYANSHCDLVCKLDDPKKPSGSTTCVFVPTGCNIAKKIGIPKSQIDQLINPKLVKPQLINPKSKLLPGDAFKPKRNLLPGDAFKPK